jgi:hypothetical protein
MSAGKAMSVAKNQGRGGYRDHGGNRGHDNRGGYRRSRYGR